MTPIPGGPQPRKPAQAPEADPLQVQQPVETLHHLAGAAYLQTEFHDPFNLITPMQANLFLREFMEAAGNPTDPILRMMLEQFAMAHHKIARLNRMSAEANTPEVARAYDASAVALLAQMRQMVPTIKAYREPTAQTHVTVVKQQNLAHNQQVAYVAAPAPVEPAATQPEKKGHDSQLTSKRLEHVSSTPAFTESAPSRGRETQPASPARPPRRVTRETPPDGVDAPTVAPVNRPKDPRR